ncbi:YfjL-like protein [Paenibacillus macerans]|uniref:YfjL-like protein n=1 Tax=Paenibacillus macerans TaxID=44252 RepID=UPI0005647071
MKYWITGLVVFTVLFFAYSIFNGTPWGKENMRKESSRYLQDKYGDEMKIESVKYDFDNSFYFKYRYYTVVHLKKNLQNQFQVNKYKEKLTEIIIYPTGNMKLKMRLNSNFTKYQVCRFN